MVLDGFRHSGEKQTNEKKIQFVLFGYRFSMELIRMDGVVWLVKDKLISVRTPILTYLPCTRTSWFRQEETEMLS